MKKISLLVGTGIGAAVQYLFDPDLGRARRSKMVSQVAGWADRRFSRLSGASEYGAFRARDFMLRDRRRPKVSRFEDVGLADEGMLIDR